MKSGKSRLSLSIMFFVLAIVFSLLFWEAAPLAAKIGLFVLGFGSGLTACQWMFERKG